MEGKVLLGLVLVAALAVSAGVIGSGKATPAASTAITAESVCSSDADCVGNKICCPITGTCTTVKGCRKDPLH